MNNKIKNYIWIGFSIIIILIIAIGFLYFFNLTSDNKYHDNNISFKYKSGWSINKKLFLIHTTGSKIYIQSRYLTNEEKAKSITEICDNLEYYLIANDQLTLINENIISQTKNNYNGCQLLFEKQDGQQLYSIFENGEKIAIITYQAENKYFDILLDSSLSLIWSFTILKGV